MARTPCCGRNRLSPVIGYEGVRTASVVGNGPPLSRMVRGRLRLRGALGMTFHVLNIRKMTRREIALHGLQAEFMRDADPDEWYELPGGTDEGQRIPDYDDGDFRIVGCWTARPLDRQ